MDKTQELKQEALEACNFRGHKMSKFWKTYGDDIYCSLCQDCSKLVVVDPTPLPNSIGISGEAVALNCH